MHKSGMKCDERQESLLGRLVFPFLGGRLGCGCGRSTGGRVCTVEGEWTVVSIGTVGFFDYLSVGEIVVVNGGPESEEVVTFTVFGLPVGVGSGHDLVRVPDWEWDLGGDLQ